MTITRGLDHLTALEVAPPQLIDFAGRFGYEAVGLRVAPVDPKEEPWPMQVGSPMFQESVSRLADAGLAVTEVEVLVLTPGFDFAHAVPTLEIGAELGAGFVYVVGQDSDLDRLSDRFAALDAFIAPYGIRPLLEPMVYRPLRDLETALRVVDRSENGGVVIDTLHFARFGGTLEQIRAADPFRIPVAQVCDAGPAPTEVPADAIAARGASTDIVPLQWEARSSRLLPGEGILPLEEIVRALPESTVIALEAPNEAEVARIGAEAWISRGGVALNGLMEAAGR